MGIFRDGSTGPEPGKRPNDGTLHYPGSLDVAKAANGDAVGDFNARTENHVGFDDDVAAEPGVGRKENRLRGNERRAFSHCLLAQVLLHHRRNPGKLGPGIHALHFVLRADDMTDTFLLGDGELYEIGQVDLALGVVGAQFRQQAAKKIGLHGHDAGIAQRDGALPGGGIELFTDRPQFPGAINDQSPIAMGVGCGKRHNRKRCRRCDHGDKPLERFGLDVRAVAKQR